MAADNSLNRNDRPGWVDAARWRILEPPRPPEVPNLAEGPHLHDPSPHPPSDPHRRRSAVSTRLHARADRHVGRRVRERRVQRGLSLAEMASALGISTVQARKYEAGLNAIPATRLPAVAAVLGVEPGWFFEELEAEALYRPLLPTRPRMLLDLVRATDDLPETGLDALCAAARALAARAG